MKNDRNLVMLSSPKIDFESFIEYGSEGRASTRGDIYSYGIMLLEMITRKKPMDEMFTGEMSLRQWIHTAIPNQMKSTEEPRWRRCDCLT